MSGTSACPGPEELARLLDEADAGDAPAALREHVLTCAACGARVGALRPVAAALARFSPLRREACPTREELFLWHGGGLARGARERIGLHAGACPLCADDLRDLAAIARPPLLRLAWDAVARALRVVREAAGLATREELVPAPAFRGEEAGAGGRSAAPAVRIAATRDVNGARLEVTVEPERAPAPPPGGGAETARFALGAILLPARAGASPLDFRIVLRRGETPLEARGPDETGRVTIHGLEPGRYSVTAHVPGMPDPIGEVDVEIAAAG